MKSSTARTKILLTGVSGYVGSQLLVRLTEQGYLVRCLARNPSKPRHRNMPGVEIVKGDVFDITKRIAKTTEKIHE
jgi:uncharacterized protein YbjT (DUF2867 family)